MSQTQLATQLQTTANIDKLKFIWRRIKLRERQEVLREKAEDAQELNFDNLMSGDLND